MQKQLLIRKLQLMEEEFTFFEYNMNSAKVLFKSNKPSEQAQKWLSASLIRTFQKTHHSIKIIARANLFINYLAWGYF